MATKVMRVLIDDLDGTDADETVTFRIGDGDYEVELSARNAAELRTALEPYRAVGRKNTKRRTSRYVRPTINRTSGAGASGAGQ